MKKLVVLTSVLALAGCALNPVKLVKGKEEKPLPGAPATPQLKKRAEDPPFWRKDGQAIAKQARKGLTGDTKAKNLILFVGEGMGVSTVTAARILAGQKAGQNGEEGALSFDEFPSTALVKTYNYDLQSPQAGGSMTALLTGLKTRGSSIGLDQIPLEGQCAAAKGHAERNILEQAKDAGMSVGLVTTARVTAAGPAAAYAHVSDPNWEVDATLSDEAIANDCQDIARQLLSNAHRPLDVVLGGGRMAFIPTTQAEKPNSRRTGVRRGPENLIETWTHAANDRQYIFTGGGLRDLKAWASVKGPVLGLFAPDHMQFETDRLTKGEDEPSLSEMTAGAIQGLKRNKNGYVLVVVAAGIGRGHGDGVAAQALYDTLELSHAVAQAVKDAGKDTLIVVTADRGSTLTIGGTPTRGNPILAAAQSDAGALTDARGQPYPTLTYGAGSPRDGAPPASPPARNDPAANTYRQPAALALPVGSGGGEDVPLYARGPGSQWFHGVLDQHGLYWIMRAALPVLENGKPIKKIAGVTPPKLPKKLPLIGKKEKKPPAE